MSLCSSALRLSLLASILASCSTNQVHSSKTQNARAEIMLNDMESAFKVVTNATTSLIRDKIIPELYNFTSASSFLFKIPNEESNLGYSIISMDRSEMLKPIFPNITLNQEEMLLKNRHLEVAVRNTEGQSGKNTEKNSALWSILGLDGWSGELAVATDLLEIEHKDKAISSDDKHSMSFETDNGTSESESDVINDESMDKAIPLTQNSHSTKPNRIWKNSTIKDLSENIYIARANDPFGFSTKWSFRNKTANIIKDERNKRDIVELYSMIKCATGCEPLTYQSYGCFCGFLGDGIAVDGIDSCCRMHDKCYEQSNCISFLQYFVPYIWKCYRGKPLCALNHGEFGGPASCAALLCFCDMRLAICLRKFTCPTCKAVCRTSLARKLQNIFF